MTKSDRRETGKEEREEIGFNRLSLRSSAFLALTGPRFHCHRHPNAPAQPGSRVSQLSSALSSRRLCKRQESMSAYVDAAGSVEIGQQFRVG